MAEIEDQGCKIHGPLRICGHIDSDCPDKNPHSPLLTSFPVNKRDSGDLLESKKYKDYIPGEDRAVILGKEEFDKPTLDFLLSLSEELWKKLRQKKFYHTTLSGYGESILKLGLKPDAPVIDDNGIAFLEEMCDKFGINKKNKYVDHYIKGNDFNEPDKKRGVYLSDYQADSFYPIPERLKFFLRNIRFLIKSNRLNDQELLLAQSIYNRHLATITTNFSSYILEIDSLAPAVFRAIFEQYGELSEETFEMALDASEPNLRISSFIDPKYIRFLRKFLLDPDEVNKMIENNFGVVFEYI